MSAGGPVLVSWVAQKNDPYERKDRSDEYLREPDGQPILGPTLALFCDDDSPFKGKIHEVVLLHREGSDEKIALERRALDETRQALLERRPGLRISLEPWRAEDPTDHKAIFEFLRGKVPELRQRFRDRELVIHATPGTPSMQTIWVLMAETGFIDQPFQLVKSYRKHERNGQPTVVPLQVGIESFYKVYMTSRPAEVTSDEGSIPWDLKQFRSEQFRKLFTEARRFAQLKVPVLILGERGTGKTKLASWIRLHSPYRSLEHDTRWPSVACGQYSPETMRAELFGYRKGAFTDAREDRDGLLAEADKDTLFLDEIGDISKDLQRLLIRALEEKQYLRLGDTRPKKSDFRLLTATNLPPTALRERLDADFLDRIGLLRLRLPPLREVPEELLWLWDATYQVATRRSGATPSQARLGASHHDQIIKTLRRHPLPGNLRDLFSVAYRLIAARCDAYEPLSPGDAMEYALEEFEAGSSPTEEAALLRDVAQAFALSQPLDPLLRPGTRLPTRKLNKELMAFVARELRRLSSVRGVPIGELCDVTDRTLRERKDPAGRKKSSDGAEG
ncbi:sigma 54-interacting transcriptional regulator [Archangium violaceum]|uniref:Sigma-54 factor interaction domain-containing protein n=1 Tax=Archangium violaceum Cb vi76 TaxID=1406225 RepID=A0A084SPE3_9BACT|nr:sigma 54-interacting transcriptional regulator [Archangium violaceum]KFA90328.1 hypothetical protein Q664_29395 [Archangium violaceum Cb vi76]